MAFAAAAGGAQLVGGMQQRSAISAANRAKETRFQMTTQAAKTGFADEMGQLAQRTTQELEASEQQRRGLESKLSDYIATKYSGSSDIAGNSLMALAQSALAKKGEADAAILRNQDMLNSRYYQEGGVRGHRAWSNLMGTYQPPMALPSMAGIFIQAGASALSAYAGAKGAGIGETAVTSAPVPQGP